MNLMLVTANDAPWSRRLLSEVVAIARGDRVGVHRLVSEPEEAVAILFVDLHQHPSDWAMRVLARHELVRRYPEKALVYDERDLPRDLLPGIYVSMPRRRFDLRRHRAFGYYRVSPELREARERTPDLLFSFQGRRAGPVRARALELDHVRAIVEDTSRYDFFGEPSAALAGARQRYLDVLGRSKFVLCPRGAGTASIRLFEVLAAGRVPVVISDEWMPPAGIEWATCSLAVPEDEMASVRERVEAREPDWPALSGAARQAYDDRFAPEVWFHRVAELARELLETGSLGPVRQWSQLHTWRAASRHLRARRGGVR